MRLWLDAQLSPRLVKWLRDSFEVDEVVALQAVPHLVMATDSEIFRAAKEAEATVMTKDRDFVNVELDYSVAVAALDDLEPVEQFVRICGGHGVGVRLSRGF